MSHSPQRKILIVEDDAGVAYLQRRALERVGFEVLLADSATDTIKALNENRIDLIVLDYRLSEEQTGLDLHRQIKASGHDVPVIIVTGFSQESTVVAALREGVRDFVAKSPDYLEYLPEAVERVLTQVHTENRLSESEERFHSFMDNSPAVAFIKDESGRLVYTNRLFQQLFSATDWRLKRDHELWAAEVAEQLRQNDLSVLASGQSAEFIEAVPLPDGKLRYWSCYKFPIYDAQGQRFVGGMALDITERRAAEESLKASEAKFRSVSESAMDGIIAIDTRGTVVSWNSGARNIFGYTAEEILGRSVETLMHERHRGRHREGLLRAVSTGELQLLGKPVELEGLKKGGASFPLEVCLGTWETEGEKYFSGIVRDITDRKRAAEALRQRDEQLQQSQKMQALGTLAGGVAHEFNNLLQAILGYTRFAMEGLADCDQRRRDLEQVITASERACSLTRQLLGFGRRQALERSLVDPNDIVGELVKMLRPLIGANIDLTVHPGKDVGQISADSGQLHQVLLNLCLNACDAMPSGGQLTLKTKCVSLPSHLGDNATRERHVAIEVSDTGSGIPPEVMERVFEPFFTTKAIGKGTGLGLAVAYSIVQQHEGLLDVVSQPGQGTAFTVYLPLARHDSGQRQSPERAAVSGGSELILVAEDEPLVRDVAVRILESAGYRTLCASDGDEALRLFADRSDEIDLVLLDVVMPKLGGHDVYREIQRLRPETAVLFCSGYDPETFATSTAGAKIARGLVQKPFQREVLLEAVRTALDADALCATT